MQSKINPETPSLRTTHNGLRVFKIIYKAISLIALAAYFVILIYQLLNGVLPLPAILQQGSGAKAIALRINAGLSICDKAEKTMKSLKSLRIRNR